MRESASTSFCDVTVVGAGPVGLLLAGELALRNVQVIVLERAQSPTRVTKANGIVGRSAVELSKRGVLSGTGLRVVSPPRFPFGPLSMNLGFGYRNPLHVLPVPQHRLEKILEERARGHGARILRGVEVLTFDQNAAEVAVETRGGGNNTHFSARFLVGCDGAHSTVRKQAGIGFSGFTGNEIARIARVVLPPTLITRTDFSCDIVDTGPLP